MDVTHQSSNRSGGPPIHSTIHVRHPRCNCLALPPFLEFLILVELSFKHEQAHVFHKARS